MHHVHPCGSAWELPGRAAGGDNGLLHMLLEHTLCRLGTHQPYCELQLTVCRCAIVRYTKISEQDILARLLTVCEKEKVRAGSRQGPFQAASDTVQCVPSSLCPRLGLLSCTSASRTAAKVYRAINQLYCPGELHGGWAGGRDLHG